MSSPSGDFWKKEASLGLRKAMSGGTPAQPAQTSTTTTTTQTTVSGKGKRKKRNRAERVTRSVAVVSGPAPEHYQALEAKLNSMESRLKAYKLDKVFRRNPIYFQYLKCLTMPNSETKFRVPDGQSVKTALVCSEHIHEVFGNYDAGTQPEDIGRFCVVVSPTLLARGFSLRRTQCYTVANPFPITYPGAFFQNDFAVASHLAYMDPQQAWDPFTALDGSIVPDADPVLRKHPELRGKPRLLEQFKALKEQTAELRRKLAGGTNTSSVSKNGTGKTIGKLLDQYNALKKKKMALLPLITSVGQWRFEQDPINQTLTRSRSAEPTSDLTSGLSTTIRPVGCSVWFQCTATEFSDGGKVAACLMPPGSLCGNIIPNDLTGTPAFNRQGPIMNWEKLAEIDGAYCGAFKNGAYCWWKPADSEDLSLRPAEVNATMDLPYMVVSGQVQNGPAAAAVDPGIVGNVIIRTVWEYQTDDQAVETDYGEFAPNLMEMTKMMLHGVPTAMPNDTHEKWWKTLLKVLGAGATGALGFMAGGPAGAGAAVTGYLAAVH